MSLAALLKELADNPGVILAWEVEGQNLSAFRIDGGAEQLALTRVERDQRASLRAEFATLGYPQGHYASEADFVWRRDGEAFVVWSSKAQVFRADANVLAFARQTIARAPDMQVVAFVDADLIKRGVRIRTPTGEHDVAIDIELRAGTDWSYGPLDALADCGWTVALGHELADFLGTTLIDNTGS